MFIKKLILFIFKYTFETTNYNVSNIYYRMKYITGLLQRILQSDIPKKPLGRWHLDYCTTKINNKIELSNEDHCGSCGQYAIIKNELNKTNISADNKNDVNIKV